MQVSPNSSNKMAMLHSRDQSEAFKICYLRHSLTSTFRAGMCPEGFVTCKMKIVQLITKITTKIDSGDRSCKKYLLFTCFDLLLVLLSILGNLTIDCIALIKLIFSDAMSEIKSGKSIIKRIQTVLSNSCVFLQAAV